MKEIRFKEDSRTSLLSGIGKVADAVSVTLGARGRNVIIGTKNGSPIITKDGVTVAKSIELTDSFENMGATLIKDVASKTNEEAGDGTTSSVVLARAIVNEGIKSVSAGYNPMGIKRGIDKATKLVVSELQDLAIEISSQEEIAQIGAISANGDKEIGEEIATALEKVGKEGIVTIEESKSSKTYTEFLDGMSFDRGYISPYFAMDRENMTTTLEDPYVLMTSSNISSMASLMPILEQLVEAQKPLLIICNDLEGDALGGLVTNLMKGVFKVCVVKPPSFSENRKSMLEDIGIVTNGHLLNEELGEKLEDLKLSDLGKAKKVVVTKNDTTIIDGDATIEDVDSRVNQIRTQLEESTSDYVSEKLQERLAKLAGGVAVLHVGAMTEVELIEKKHRLEDALSATRAGIEEGIIAGGGTALVQISVKLNSIDISSYTEEEKIGFNIVKRAIEEPVRQIAENAGEDGAVVANEVKRSKKGIGFDAQELKYVDMLKAGIIDPVKVTRIALESASSVAGLLITTEVSIVEIEDK
ncbi:MAG: chaperonin GroEL [Candidatus Woesearchaeota archaeon]|nr:chaperonin GroEL [Candidatus Woesearchaeota archaeon]